MELFVKESLHHVHHPKVKKAVEPPPNCDVKLRLTNGKLGVLTPAGFLADEAYNINTAREIASYRDSKAAKTHELEKRSKSVQDLQINALERSKTYLRIKRLLKFSKDRKPAKADEDEDEGYSSKTSSAEQRCSGSDNEESGETNEKERMYSSMVNLSELPSNSKDHRVADPKTLNEIIAMSRGKFNYTHQPTILQLPNPEISLTHDKLRVEKKVDPDDNYWSYARLKRSKELNKNYRSDSLTPTEENSVYSIDNNKPMTLVLRKISIQNSDHQLPSAYQPVSPVDSRSLESQPTGKPNLSLSLSRAGSSQSMAGTSRSRAGSAMSRAGSRTELSASNRVGSPQGRSLTQGNFCPSSVDKNASMSYMNGNVRDVSKPDNKGNKEQMWSPQFSFIDRQTTNYCIGDLLPAMDKNIYSTTNNSAKLKFGAIDDEKGREDMTKVAERLQDFSRDPQADDGYILLKKGMEMLTGASEKVY